MKEHFDKIREQPQVQAALDAVAKAAQAFSPKDPQLVEATLGRLDQQDIWNDVFSTKLIEVLDKIDGIRAQTRATVEQAQGKYQEASDSMIRTQRDLDVRIDELRNELETKIERNRAESRQTLTAIEAREAEYQAKVGTLGRNEVSYVIAAVGLSWIGIIWTLWLALHLNYSAASWTAVTATAIVTIGSLALMKSTRAR